MENFIKVLTAGLAIFAILAIANWFGPYVPQEEDFRINETLFAAEKIGNIGFAEATPREIDLGSVSVGTLVAEENTFQEKSVVIKNGLFSKKGKSITFGGEGVIKATLSFYVDNSNNYGALNVFFGGKNLLGQKAAPGRYKFELYDLNATNTIEISADSSGAKFWAPTTYFLSEVSVDAEKYAERDKVVPFQVYSYESSGWSLGRVTFVPENITGPADLSIEVNGKQVYSGVPAIGLPAQKDFTKQETRISPGENIISFKTGKDTVYGLKNTKLIIFYYGTGEAIYKIQQFDLNDYWTAQLRKENKTGVASFYVKNAFLDSGLDVSINNRTQTIDHLSSNAWYNVTFSEKDISGTGKNIIKFSTHGSYELGELKIEIRSGVETKAGETKPLDVEKTKESERLRGVLMGAAVLALLFILVYFFKEAKWLWISISVIVLIYLFFKYILFA